MSSLIEKIDLRIEGFKDDLRSDEVTLEEIFQKHLVESENFYFQNVASNSSLEFKMKSILANAFDVHLNEVVMVGSAKIGFSLKSSALFREFDGQYKKSNMLRDKSDVDIAIICPDLFEKLGVKLYNYTDKFKNKWQTNEYYKKTTPGNISIAYKFFEYYTKGWIRPDYSPLGFEICPNDNYQKLKYTLSRNLDNRTVAVGIYKNWYYFKNYHLDNLNSIRFKLNEIV